MTVFLYKKLILYIKDNIHEGGHTHRRRGYHSAGILDFCAFKQKMFYLTNQLFKLNFDCTIVFLRTRSSKLHHIWLCLDNIFLKYFYLIRNNFYPWNILFYFEIFLFDSGIFLSCFGTFYLILKQFASLEHF